MSSEFVEHVEDLRNASPPPYNAATNNQNYHITPPQAHHSERSEHAEHAEHLDHEDFVAHANASHDEFVENDNPDFVENVDDDVEFVENVNSDPNFVEHAESNQNNPDFVEHAEGSALRPSLSRRSTIMLDEEELPPTSAGLEDEGPFSRAQEGDQVGMDQGLHSSDGLVETVIEWKEGGRSVFVTGSFTSWRQMIPLRQFDDHEFMVVLKLAPGTHRLRFVVDGELRCSNYMSTATDSMGNLVNYMEVEASQPSEHEDPDGLSRSNSSANAELEEIYGTQKSEYTREIPEIFADPEALDRFSSIDFMPPPQLPPHLDGVILNTNWTEKDNNSVLPIPNHVVLNHLATTSIKHNVLAVASVSRYKSKYVTQILYSPLQGI